MRLNIRVTAIQAGEHFITSHPAAPRPQVHQPPTFALAPTKPTPHPPDLQSRLLKAWGRLFTI